MQDDKQSVKSSAIDGGDKKEKFAPSNMQIRNTAAHILGMAVANIYPTVKRGDVGQNDLGFFYDFDFSTPIKNEDLAKIESEMRRIVKSNFKPEISETTKVTARKKFATENYKNELVGLVPSNQKAKICTIDTFVDLCGSSSEFCNTGNIKAFKLTAITGAYFRGDAKNKMLTRITGVAFATKEELANHLEWQEEIKRRDHNKIGRELELFMTSDVVGQGLIHFLPKGWKVMQTLIRFVEDEEERRGYFHVKTPLFAKKDLYMISGHWTHYKDGMFVIGNEVLDEEVFALRPMTCPYHFMTYKNSLKSYRDLPIRYGETSTLFRNEHSGEMHGLTRMRQFTLSEGHIMARPDQIQQIFDECLDLSRYFMNAIGISDKVTFRLSKWDPKKKDKYFGKPADWERAQNELRQVLVRAGIEFEEAEGDAAFYGPKIDLQAKNVHGKEDTIITIQLDFLLAERFDMTYTNEQGEKVRPVIIHRASIGCYERTLAMIIENCAGSFPLWLAPVQAVVMGISEKQDEYASDVFLKLRSAGIRIEKDTRPERVGYKIREHTKKRVPYLVVVGEKELETNTIAVRTREGEDLGSMTIDAFIEITKKRNAEFN